MGKYVFRFPYINRISIGSIDLILNIEKITYKDLDIIREEIINNIRLEGKDVDSDSFGIIGWSRIYD